MNFEISGINVYNKTLNYPAKHINKGIQPSFSGVKNTKAVQNYSIALALASLIAIFSCSNNKQEQSTDTEKTTPAQNKVKNSDTFDEKKQTKTYYHYLPKKDNVVNPDEYEWSETVYPDGKIEKDSMGYKIIIMPEGDRIIVKTPQEENKDTITVEETPDSLINNTTEKNDTTDTIEQRDIEYITINNNETDYDYQNTAKPINKHYNDEKVLLYWESDDSEINKNDSTNVFDNKGRLIYDSVNNEQYEYRGKSKTPYKSINVIEDCTRYTLYNKNGSIKSRYFKASDGTITNINDIKKSK